MLRAALFGLAAAVAIVACHVDVSVLDDRADDAEVDAGQMGDT